MKVNIRTTVTGQYVHYLDALKTHFLELYLLLLIPLFESSEKDCMQITDEAR